MRILFTGASSFTGYWFARELVQAGHELTCPLRGRLEDYAGVRRRRAEALKSLVRFLPGTSFGAEGFLKLARDGSWDVLCHHAAEVTNYKSPEFDAQAALHHNTLNLPGVLEALKSGGVPAMVLTGTVFESGEGAGDEPLRAFSPYGLSKTLTWEMFLYYCTRAELPLGKFVIPNPFGPLEEERFTGYLMSNWREGRIAAVKTPAYVRDNIPVDLLASMYRQFVETVAARKPPLSRFNPSGYVSEQGAFAQRVARETQARLDWACELELWQQTDFSEPLRRINREPAAPLAPAWDETAFWDAFAEFYSRPRP